MKPTIKIRLAAILLASLWASMAWSYDPLNREEYLAKIKQAEAYYKDKCEKVAAIKIYKTVPEVEGVLLMKIRPNRTDRELADPNWPGAAFGRESSEEGYITSFLGYEHRATENNGTVSSVRGYINTDKRPGGLPGYRWVEVIDPNDGQRYRYVLEYKEVTRTSSPLIGGDGKSFRVKENVLTKTPSPSKTPPRYAVTFEDHVIPEERAMWVTSSTVKVIDLKTDEVLGEMTRYAMSYIHAPRHSMPWLNHHICPNQNMTGDSHSTRKFVDQILIPKREK